MHLASADKWKMSPEEKAKYDAKFFRLKPLNGFITGEQAKNLFLESGLYPQSLIRIWDLADRDARGKLNCSQFSIAMHLIELKRKGIGVPKELPPSLAVLAHTNEAEFRPQAGPPVPTAPPCPIENSVGFEEHSISNQDSHSVPLNEWVISKQSKWKFSRLFNSYTRTGFLTNGQAKNILLNTGLSQQILGHIWSVSDVDADGRLSCDEFVLAMHLAEKAEAGFTLPRSLPVGLVPPSHHSKQSTNDDFDSVFNQTSLNNCTVYCTELSIFTTSASLKKIFSSFGIIENIDYNLLSALIRFNTKEAATLAICSINNTKIDGLTVKCTWAPYNPNDHNHQAQAASLGQTPSTTSTQLPSQKACLPFASPSTSVVAKKGKTGKIKGVEAKVEEKPSEVLCKICMEDELGVVFLPCGHLTACVKCSQEISTCPLCRKLITTKVRTYLG